jgi:hypothetical protein
MAKIVEDIEESASNMIRIFGADAQAQADLIAARMAKCTTPLGRRGITVRCARSLVFGDGLE